MGNDLVTLVLCVPLLLVSAYFAAKGSLRGRLVWTALVFYFVYVYGMMSFESAYNQLFLVYVATFSLSLYTFAASLLTLDVNRVKESLVNAPVKLTAGFMFLIGIMISLMWLGPDLRHLRRPCRRPAAGRAGDVHHAGHPGAGPGHHRADVHDRRDICC